MRKKQIEKVVDQALAKSGEPGAMPLEYGPHERFSQLVAGGMSQSGAYKIAVLDPEASSKNVATMAAALASSCLLRIQCLRARAEAIAVVTSAEVMEGARHVYGMAVDPYEPNLGAANQSLRLLGDLGGHFKQEQGSKVAAVSININIPPASQPTVNAEVIEKYRVEQEGQD